MPIPVVSCGLLWGLWLLALTGLPGFAQEPAVDTFEVTWREVFVTVKNTPLGIPTGMGHTLGLMEQRGLAFYESGEVATIRAWLTYEGAGGQVAYRGYLVYTFRDGATQTARFDGTGNPVGAQKGAFAFIGGTGRYKGIQGGGTFTAEGFPPKADLYVDAKGKYTLPGR